MLSAMGIKSFAFCLERGRDAPGWLAIGPRVQAMAETSANFQALTVVGKVHWGLKMTNLHVPGLAAADPCVPSCGAIVDSGTSLIAAPSVAAGFIRRLAQLIHGDCSNMDSLPILRMELDGKVIELPPAAYVMRTRTTIPRNSSIWKRMFAGAEEHQTIHRCRVAFMTLDKHSQYGPVWILGMPFLRYYYTVFDRASKTIHVAPSTPSCKILSKPISLINTTHRESHASAPGEGAGSRFTATDFEATDVDLNAARIPGWATTPDSKVSL